MPDRDIHVHDDQVGRDDDTVRAAVRYSLIVIIAGVGFLIIAAVWVSTCGTDAETVACGRPERFLLAVIGAAILGLGGIGAFVRTYRIWRREGTWWGWQGAGWVLLTMALMVFTMSFPAVAGYTG